MNAINCLGCIRSQDLCVVLLQRLKSSAWYKIQDLCVILFQAHEFLSWYYNQKRDGVRSTNAHPDRFNRPSIKPRFWGLFPHPTFLTSASTLPQILQILNSQPKCTHNTSHTRCSHHVHNHHSDHSHQTCIAFIKDCTETCYTCFERICHRLGQSIKNSTYLSKNFEHILTFTIVLICYLTQFRQLHLH
jgi:hypothetical protein